MKYSLRSLMVVALVLPPLLAGAYFVLINERLRFLAATTMLLGGLVLAAIACGGLLAHAKRFPKE